MRSFYFSLILLILFSPAILSAFNDDRTHPRLTERASDTSNSIIDEYLKKNLRIDKGLDEPVEEKTILEWLKHGATMEDAEDICRASNHFHNPNLFWGGSGLTGISLPVKSLSYFNDYQHNARII